ncbi:SnoaL-like domain-containing protein [Actinoplanes sp. TBRC 11911]|uniref:nuclear transport factor 2 family protein n=1 Tax=Actinoplanes sp. TBRC 11911 TaxID=2729386 RepID=UPI00145E5815|nr:nuclear transport factor 2 family protein [Actinoplanes sp. TBRC 11911]NMO55263.1 SnoaL-like domain-containing protein [Actinoplanes sp. TBRC 11911]
MSDVREIAQKTYDALNESFGSGVWDGFFDLFGPEVDVIVPAPGSGRFTGTEGRAKLVEFFSMFKPGMARFDEVEEVGVTVGEDRVVFENWARGEVNGQPYEARHCIHVMVRDGKAVGFHEYNRPA